MCDVDYFQSTNEWFRVLYVNVLIRAPRSSLIKILRRHLANAFKSDFFHDRLRCELRKLDHPICITLGVVDQYPNFFRPHAH